MSQPSSVQGTIIQQVRHQLGGILNMSTAGGNQRQLQVPIRGVRFVLDTDENAILVCVRSTRVVRIAYNPGSDLYDVKITDLNRSGISIVAEREIEGIYSDSLGELIQSPRLAKVGC